MTHESDDAVTDTARTAHDTAHDTGDTRLMTLATIVDTLAHQHNVNRAILDTLKDMQSELDSLHTQVAYQREANTSMLGMLDMLAEHTGLTVSTKRDTGDTRAPRVRSRKRQRQES